MKSPPPPSRRYNYGPARGPASAIAARQFTKNLPPPPPSLSSAQKSSNKKSGKVLFFFLPVLVVVFTMLSRVQFSSFFSTMSAVGTTTSSHEDNPKEKSSIGKEEAYYYTVYFAKNFSTPPPPPVPLPPPRPLSELEETIFTDPVTGARRLTGTTVQSTVPVYAYLTSLPPAGFPYEYYFENGVTHLVFQRVSFCAYTILLNGVWPNEAHANETCGDRNLSSSLPHPSEWARIHEIARRYHGKLILGIGGVDWFVEKNERNPQEANADEGGHGDSSSSIDVEQEAKKMSQVADVWMMDGVAPENDFIQNGLAEMVDLYFHRLDDKDKKRFSREESVRELATILVDWDFSGVDVDFRALVGVQRPSIWAAVKNLLRDIRETVKRVREERVRAQVESTSAKNPGHYRHRPRYSYKYPHFLTSLTAPVMGEMMAGVQIIPRLTEGVDVVHWRMFHAPVGENFLVEKWFEQGDGKNTTSIITPTNKDDGGTEEAAGFSEEGEGDSSGRGVTLQSDRKDVYEVGHGPQYGGFYSHSNLNYTIYNALHIAESRYEGEYLHHDMGRWFRRSKVLWEDEIILEELSPYFIRWSEFEKRKRQMVEAGWSLCIRPSEAEEGKKRKAEEEEEEDWEKVEKGKNTSRISPIHSLMIPFFGMDTIRGPRPYKDIFHTIQKELSKSEDSSTEHDDHSAAAATGHRRREEKNDGSSRSTTIMKESDEDSFPFEEEAKHISVVDGMGFDNGNQIREKIRIAAQLGFGAVALYGVELDVLPSAIRSPSTPPPRVPNLSTFSFSVDNKLDLSLGKTYYGEGSPFVPFASPPSPPAPPLSLLHAVKSAIGGWKEEQEEGQPQQKVSATTTTTTSSSSISNDVDRNEDSASGLEERVQKEEEGSSSSHSSRTRAVSSSLSSRGFSSSMCTTPTPEELQPFLFLPNTYISRLHRLYGRASTSKQPEQQSKKKRKRRSRRKSGGSGKK